MSFTFNHRIIWPSVLLPTLGFFLASLGYHDWMHLGAEYDEIARAIYKGRAFSDPFGIETGPTAWMPPVLPMVMAAGYFVAGGERNIVMILFLLLQWTAIASASALVLHEAVRLNRYRWGLAIVIVGLAINFDLLFRMTHDYALLLLLANVLFVVMTHGCERLLIRAATTHGLFGGLVALCNPILAIVWATWITVMSKSIRTVLISAVVSIAVITPWTIRNYLVFDRIIPIKSAAKFEFYQALCVSQDGIVDLDCFWQHPWNRDNAARREYASVGESAFIEARGLPASRKLWASPVDCVDRLINRLVTATLWSETPTTFGSSFVTGLFNRLFFPWPFLSLVVLVLCKASLKDNPSSLLKHWQIATILYAGVLLPYVLISYYTRYAAPLIAVKCLLVLYLVNSIMLKLDRVKARPSVPQTIR